MSEPEEYDNRRWEDPKVQKPNAIIIDLDSTLANNDHRQQFLTDIVTSISPNRKEEDEINWRKFNEGIPDDTVNEWCKKIMTAFSDTHKIIILTGRGEDVWNTTENWLRKHEIPYDNMFVRSYPEFGDDSLLYKARKLKEIMKSYNVTLAIDDERRICKMFHEAGIPTLNVITDYNIEK